MYIVTGAAGFIGSCVAAALARMGWGPLVLVDDFSREDKRPNWADLPASETVDREAFWDWVVGKEGSIQAVIHLGARTDTAEMDKSIFDHLNFGYSQKMWQLCAANGIPLVYASSAATYGEGEFGFDDDQSLIPELKPLNPYGESKNEFDKWALAQPKQPRFWAGLKFFNVYGPNEFHKGRMASVIFHAFGQIQATGRLRLFKSHRPDFKDGEQMRDFVYVRDVVKVIQFLLDRRPASGIYNLGTGQARTFLDLGKAVFKALGQEPVIDFVDTPADIRDKYQYFTEAKMDKLRNEGYG
ncbi:MAG TPA: ADP-glyceromanno-heptose 6-epimerase, partial [Bacteroidia bacterium]|nr:ADP-glyceromanno-heptose 6-epimerase [Bacteroidia bacterium]